MLFRKFNKGDHGPYLVCLFPLLPKDLTFEETIKKREGLRPVWYAEIRLNLIASGDVMHLSEAMKREAAFKGKTTASGCAADCNINLPGLDWIDMVNVLEQKIQSRQVVFQPKRLVAMKIVEDELARLEQIGVLQPVTYSKWAAPIAVT
ncbi:unnamed protein product [Hymenolepis diminuta]|uniref:Reverse transcriptase domain-containing protein n=1 Tax=Hymenolepis diminuta TaxID=6216 RepID=A0A0R3S7L7_HYMDI|nr:unnamed protein product [Hymenolepis diminuta]